MHTIVAGFGEQFLIRNAAKRGSVNHRTECWSAACFIDTKQHWGVWIVKLGEDV